MCVMEQTLHGWRLNGLIGRRRIGIGFTGPFGRAPRAWEVVRFETPGGGRRKFGTSVGTEPNRPDPGELPPPTHNPYWGA